jgi:sugar-specific transcriptional regulator TrmB
LLPINMEEVLKSLGLTNSQIRVYKALTELGSAPAAVIAQRAKVYRTNLYDILEQLRKKGLVTSNVHNKTLFFSITEPRNLLTLMEEQKASLRKTEADLHECVKSLKRAPVILNRKNIVVYQDREGLQYFYEQLVDMAQSHDEVLVIGSSATIFDAFNYYILNLSKRIREINVRGRMIANKEIIRNAIMQRTMGLVKMKLRSLPKGYVSPAAIFIFKDTVGFCNFMENPFVIMVDDKNFAHSYKKHFNDLWKTASPENILD